MEAAAMRDLKMAVACLAALLVVSGNVAEGAIKGRVVNGTTNAPVAGVDLTLASFLGGMSPVEEAVSGEGGSFEFSSELRRASAEQRALGVIRAELDGVNYTHVLAADEPTDAIEVTVYSASAERLPAPTRRVVLLEASETQIDVSDMFLFVNDSEPPVTYSSPEGTLRFFLAKESGGDVNASGEGPAGMPLRSTALPTDNPEVYKVDFPLKPGTNTINLTYALPRREDEPFRVRSAYGEVETLLAAPEGVVLEGVGLEVEGQIPGTRASRYRLPSGSEADITVQGTGELRRPESTSKAPEISVQPAPIADELAWISVISVLIFALGFFHLLKSRAPHGRGGRG